MRHRTLILLPLIVLCSLTVSLTAAEPKCQLTVVTDPPEAIYTVGQQAKFVVSLKKDGQPVTEAEVTCILDVDGMPPTVEKKVKLEQGTAVVEGTLPAPGFLRCRASYTAKDQPAQTALAGAAFDPLKIPPSLPVPDDFDAFWSEQKSQLAAVPMKPELTAVTSPSEGIEAFDVQIPCVGPRPVSGYFAKPAGAAPKSLPAILCVHGAGVCSSNLPGTVNHAKRYQALAMDINAHGIPNGKPKAFYDELAAGELKDYRTLGCHDRQQCYFLGMFLRLMRALEFLTAQSEWDGKILIVKGSSQGGGQAIAAAGLDPRVTLIAAGVPAICDHSGKAVGRINGWPHVVPNVNGKPDEKILQTMRYFDGMNFATRAKAEAIFSVGFIDPTCQPTSVYAAYNNLPGPKQIINEPLMGHAMFPKFEQATATAIQEHIQRLQGK